MKEHNSKRRRQIILVLEGFGVLIMAHFFPWFFLKPLLVIIFPKAPEKTLSLLSSSAISPIIASFYLFARTRMIPKIIINKKEMVYIVLAGMVGIWINESLMLLIFGERMQLFDKSVKSVSVYIFIDIFFYTIWAPLIEELLFRGYFLEILKSKWNNVSACLLSSLLFVLPHILLSPGILSVTDGMLIGAFIFINSIIFSMAYIQGGLISAFIVHAFSNFYRLIL